MENEIYYTDSEIYIKYNLLSDFEKTIKLYDALGYMEQYNGRSKFTCIAMAMGYLNTEGVVDKWTKIKS